MRKLMINKAKLVVKVSGDKTNKTIKTISVYDNRTQAFWPADKIKERGITHFLNMEDMKETLNWNLYGDDTKYQFTWGQSGKTETDGYAYIVD